MRDYIKRLCAAAILFCRPEARRREAERIVLVETLQSLLTVIHFNIWDKSGWELIDKYMCVLETVDEKAANAVRTTVKLWQKRLQ